MANIIGNPWVKADRICDYIPVISTASNLIDLFQKCVVLPRMSRQAVARSHYYTHLQQKSFLRCALLLIPLIGNIFVGLYDLANKRPCVPEAPIVDAQGIERDRVLAAVRRNGLALRDVDTVLKGDREVVLTAVRRSGLALLFASYALKGDREIVLAAVQQNGKALQDASYALKGDREIVLTAVQQNGYALYDTALRGDREVVLAAVRQDGCALQYASDALKGDREVVLAAVRQNWLALQYASDALKGDREIAITAIKSNPSAYCFVGEGLANNENFIREVALEKQLWYANMSAFQQ